MASLGHLPEINLPQINAKAGFIRSSDCYLLRFEDLSPARIAERA
jgi:hypothetical protein